jgi:serine/threonine-protein kinase
VIGSVLDKYEVLQKLGEGATATVYRGRHLTIGKDVAIKVLHPHLSASSRYRERFNREARAVGRLSHQNIVSILDYSGQSADDCYIVTELIDGVTILELLQQRGRLPSEIAALVAADLASALAFAHTAGIIHRDIKPENVMLRRDGRVKLMDFGVARVLDESSITLDGSLLGSPAYMSPQQALDEPLDGRSDLFSLGTVLFHAVTGHVPFSGSNASVILKNVIEGNRPEVLELAPHASPALASVIDRLLQPRPEDRYPTATDAHEALVACLDEVRLPLDHPTINLRAYLLDPDATEAALAAHLRVTLLELGKDRLGRGDPLGALQLFNRLLAVDEDNAEVIALIQALHQGPPARPRLWGLAALVAATLIVAGAAGAWWVWGRTDVPPPRAHLAAADPGRADPAPAPATGTSTADALPAGPDDTDPGTSDAGTADAVAVPAAADLSGAASPHPPPGPASPAGSGPLHPVDLERRAALRPSPTGEPTRAPADAEVVVTLSEPVGEAELWVDGKMVGMRLGGPRDKLVGIPANPLRLPPGVHTIGLRNQFWEPWEERVELAEGEPLVLPAGMRKRKVTFIVNARLPDACKMTVGTNDYDTLKTFRSFALVDPLPDTPVILDCPAPFGKIRTVLGTTEAGGSKVIPSELPAEGAP